MEKKGKEKEKRMIHKKIKISKKSGCAKSVCLNTDYFY